MGTDLLTVEKMHDLLLLTKPSEASHDTSTCPYCVSSDDGAEDHALDTPSGGGDMSTYTQEELQAAIADAVGPVAQELSDLKASQDQAAIEARINELAEQHEAEKAELQAQLDQAKAEAEASKSAHDELVAFFEEEAAKAEAEAALDARRQEVKAVVAEFFSDEEYIETNIDRWASMEAEAFENVVQDWKAAAEAAKKVSDSTEEKDPLATTAMQASADGAPDSKVDMAEIRRALARDRRAVRNVGASTR